MTTWLMSAAIFLKKRLEVMKGNNRGFRVLALGHPSCTYVYCNDDMRENKSLRALIEVQNGFLSGYSIFLFAFYHIVRYFHYSRIIPSL